VSTAWTQPVFTNYTTADGSRITAGNEQTTTSPQEFAWKAMDGYTSGSDRFWGTTITPTWWKVVFPYKVLITRLIHYNRYDGAYANIEGRYWADEALDQPIGDAFSSGSVSWGTVTVYDGTAIPTDRIYFQKTGGNQYSGIGEVVITARKITYEVPK
jgi:hypothetical protein